MSVWETTTVIQRPPALTLWGPTYVLVITDTGETGKFVEVSKEKLE